MSWTAYASNSNLIKNSGQLLSAETVAGNGLWLSNRDITDSSIPSLNSNRGILLNIEGCLGLNHDVTTSSYYYSPQSQCNNFPIVTGYFWGNAYDGWQHNSNYPWIGLTDVRIILSKKKGGTSGLTYSSIMNDSVYITNVFNGVINDTIIVSPQATNQNDGYSYLYVSGAYDNFPDYRYSGGVYESYCYAPPLNSISSYADINTYLSQGYYYVGVHIYLRRQQFYFNAGGQGSGNHMIWGTAVAPMNEYCTASYTSSFINGSKVNVGGTWKGIQHAQVYVNGEWKDVKQMKVYQNDQWKEVPQQQIITWAQK